MRIVSPRSPFNLTERQLIKLAVKLIEDEREIAISSFTDVNGRITNVDDRKIVRSYDRFLKPARDWLRRHA